MPTIYPTTNAPPTIATSTREGEDDTHRSRGPALCSRDARPSVEVGEQVERARHEHGLAELVRAGEQPRPDRRRPRPGRNAAGERARAAAGSARGFEDCVGTKRGRPARSSRASRRVLVARGSTRTRRSRASRKPCQEPARHRRGCARRRGSRRLAAPAARAARCRAGRRSRWPANASAASRAPPRTTHGGRARDAAYLLSDRTTMLFGDALRPASRPRSPPRVSPSTSVCSRPTFVSRTTLVSRTFVASSRPPSPASTTATSTLARRELRKGRCRDRLELRRRQRSAYSSHARDRLLEVGVPPSTWIRSAQPRT